MEEIPASALEELAIFPLPDLVLFPNALLPLHIFEPRYRDMMADVLEGARLLAVVRLMPGFEDEYEGRPGPRAPRHMRPPGRRGPRRRAAAAAQPRGAHRWRLRRRGRLGAGARSRRAPGPPRAPRSRRAPRAGHRVCVHADRSVRPRE